jgi:hypothetical protein
MQSESDGTEEGVPASAPALHANARVDARVRNKCVKMQSITKCKKTFSYFFTFSFAMETKYSYVSVQFVSSISTRTEEVVIDSRSLF